jgi:glycolate oxidase
MLAFFPTLDSAGEAVAGIAAAGISPVTLELLDRFTIAAVDDMNNLGLDRTAAAMLMIESDMPAAAAADELERAEAACRAAGATDVVRAADAQESDLLRQARRAAHWALERLGEVRMEDVAVPRSKVPDMLRAIERIAAKHEVQIGTFGHAGDGNLHPELVFERGDARAEALTKVIQADLYRAALDLGGTVTAEHGIGVARREWLEIQRGPDAVRIMRAIKTALDPLGILNPGRVLERRSSAQTAPG